MIELSVIVPFCNEYPQVVFTAQSILNEFRAAKIDFELICIHNWSEREMKAQGRAQDRGFQFMDTKNKGQPWLIDLDPIFQDGENEGPALYVAQDKGYSNMEGWQKINPELKVISYDKKLSHWQAKNAGVGASSGKFLWFCDSHCVVYPNTAARMFTVYKDRYKNLRGTLHLPLSYMMDAPGRELIYKLTGDISKGEVHYSFTRYRPSEEIYRVPCMSTCGMMMAREIYDELGGWPEELGIYGGGENFINFTLATLGYTINIFPSRPLYHYAEKRGYHWNFSDHLRNKAIATFLFSDYNFLKLFMEHHRGTPIGKQQIIDSVITCPSIIEHREMLLKKRVIDIKDWWRKWQTE